jgi:hypothetical protein
MKCKILVWFGLVWFGLGKGNKNKDKFVLLIEQIIN